jgi:hypothetical protein
MPLSESSSELQEEIVERLGAADGRPPAGLARAYRDPGTGFRPL